MQLLVVDFFRGVLADRFEDGNNVEIPSVQTPGKDGSAVDEDRRTVEARNSQHATGHVLVAPADGHESVESLAAHDRFDRFGDDLARNERVFHPFGAHRNAIGNGDGVEDNRFAARCIGAARRFAREHVDVHVAGRDHAPSGSDAHLRFAEVFFLEPDGIEHGAARGAFRSVEDLRGILAEDVAFRACGFLAHAASVDKPAPRVKQKAVLLRCRV